MTAILCILSRIRLRVQSWTLDRDGQDEGFGRHDREAMADQLSRPTAGALTKLLDGKVQHGRQPLLPGVGRGDDMGPAANASFLAGHALKTRGEGWRQHIDAPRTAAERSRLQARR